MLKKSLSIKKIKKFNQKIILNSYMKKSDYIIFLINDYKKHTKLYVENAIKDFFPNLFFFYENNFIFVCIRLTYMAEHNLFYKRLIYIAQEEDFNISHFGSKLKQNFVSSEFLEKNIKNFFVSQYHFIEDFLLFSYVFYIQKNIFLKKIIFYLINFFFTFFTLNRYLCLLYIKRPQN